MNRDQFNILVNAGIINAKDEKKPKGKPKLTIGDIMIKLEFFNRHGIIKALNIQDSGINACKEYTHISFKIPKE